MRPWIDQAVRSGASGRSIVDLSFESSRMRSEARMREKCFQRGFIRNFLPSAETARLRWLATASCQSFMAASLNAAARSTRNCHSSVSRVRAVLSAVRFPIIISWAEGV
jgi:hypothetical protein